MCRHFPSLLQALIANSVVTISFSSQYPSGLKKITQAGGFRENGAKEYIEALVPGDLRKLQNEELHGFSPRTISFG